MYNGFMDVSKELKIGFVIVIFFVTYLVFVLKQPSKMTTQPETIAPTVSAKTYSLADVATHNNKTDCWFVVNANVYNVTGYENSHPGGAQNITNFCGKDATAYFTAEKKRHR